ncbi:L-aminoadipate-semialdehyde dehydrogenase-phosphopantetheinyl transferase [Caenorhabditis elegans]|uniref:L-aminoadipate-semialdehyde dehydrogenase-phosphopantetheinyl transferase n=1 Tax=Caenorhabditis elegans TaxID=6239 RepID=Q22856_CAEEL|nr:L-aminoadipate-semialdehyde dehydrogenase-phosphopantetheinyl transferase [Caenorhabditis elegans]CAA99933.2 L-aminoadipate-semialdehyde dehydrogenase-phosphopantetheinyl transferase [Caenorhabditis elegans]|eukprot:NP_506135.2 Uncharacterized protein CELE_T28H10.1 [Caenorhabditis elegans]
MSLRWAISLEETITSSTFQNMFRRAILCASESDVEQQRRFRYKEDALACLIGRLIPRKAATISISRQWSDLEFSRNENGKPSLIQNKSDYSRQNFEYNVSHHGDLVVLATGDTRIGVDVMRVNEARRETASEQMNTLKRHFSENEIEMVKGGDKCELKRWHAFYRIWCLKESILKATGVGLPDGLHNHTFQVDSSYDHASGHSTVSTQYYHRLIPQPQWIFEESFIGENHCVAVASEVSPSTTSCAIPFQMMSLEEILQDADFINITADVDEELDVFMGKSNKPF